MPNKYLFLLFIFLASFNLNGQVLEVASGINLPRYFHYEGVPAGGEYEAVTGIHFGFAYKKRGNDFFDKSAYININLYSGDIWTSAVSSGGGSNTNIIFNNISIGLTYFAVNLPIVKEKLHLNFGPNISFFAKKKMSVTTSNYSVGFQRTWEYSTKESKKLANIAELGLVGRIKGIIKLSNTLSISPQYNFNFGITDEFKTNQVGVKRMLHTVSVGVIWNLEKSQGN